MLSYVSGIFHNHHRAIVYASPNCLNNKFYLAGGKESARTLLEDVDSVVYQ